MRYRPVDQMNVFALSDLHLSSAVEGKSMERFGEEWRDHDTTIRAPWEKSVGPDDLVLVPGDISWASRIEQAADLEYLVFPGTFPNGANLGPGKK
jgi:predicted phosphohydrolase